MSDPRTADAEPEPGADPAEAPAGRLRRFTASRGRRRLLVGVAIVLLMIFLAAPTAKIYLDQQAEIEQLEASIADQRTTRDELQDELALWQDPEHMEQQASDRLMMVEPGQRSYLVVGADEVGTGAPSSSAVEEQAGSPAWADSLWGSVKDSAWPERGDRGAGSESFPDLGGDDQAEQPQEAPAPTGTATQEPSEDPTAGSTADPTDDPTAEPTDSAPTTAAPTDSAPTTAPTD